MNASIATLTFIAAASLFTVGCATKVADGGLASVGGKIESSPRTPASTMLGGALPGGYGITARTKSLSFSLNENRKNKVAVIPEVSAKGIKLAESNTLTYEAPAAKYSAEIERVFSGEILAATGEYSIIQYDGDSGRSGRTGRAGRMRRFGRTGRLRRSGRMGRDGKHVERPISNNIVLRKIYDGKSEFQDWYKESRTGNGDPRSGSIITVGQDGEEVRINFFGATPVKWQNSIFVHSTGRTVEEIKFSVERIEMAVENSTGGMRK